jgi:DNA-binding NtrC family response regulator
MRVKIALGVHYGTSSGSDRVKLKVRHLQQPGPCIIDRMILLVEDDATSRRAVNLILKTAGHEVMSAGDGTEALELLAKHHFDLVITDLVMPNLNGLNLINAIRLKQPHLPLILMSGHLFKDAGKAVMEGIAAYLQKPFTPTALIMTVERVLSRSNSHRKIR